MRPSTHPYIHPSSVNQGSLLGGGTGIYSIAQGGLIGLRCSVFLLRANSNIEATCVRACTCATQACSPNLYIRDVSMGIVYIFSPSLVFLLSRHVGTHHIFQPLR